jgi:uncharacterized NAD(P)/FAD-binding protein YdhS
MMQANHDSSTYDGLRPIQRGTYAAFATVVYRQLLRHGLLGLKIYRREMHNIYAASKKGLDGYEYAEKLLSYYREKLRNGEFVMFKKEEM